PLTFFAQYGLVQYDTFESVQVIAAPVISLTPPAAFNEGGSVHLVASVSPLGSTNSLDGPLAWDIDGDGQYGEVVGTDVMLDWNQLRALGIDDDGVFQIGARAINGDGFESTAFTTLTIGNTAPTIALSANTSVATDAPFQIGFSATDPGNDRVTAWEIDWTGDGSQVETFGSTTRSATHVFDEPGTYTVTVRATDEDTTSVATHVVDVTVSAAEVSAGGPYRIREGEDLTLTAIVAGTPDSIRWDVNGDLFVDATSADTTLVLSWSQLQGLLGPAVDGDGTYAVRVQATYANNAFAVSAPVTLTVDNAAPTVDAISVGAVREGEAAVIRFSNAFDPSNADTDAGFSYTVSLQTPLGNYQDTVQSLDAIVDMTIPAHVIADNGDYNVLVRITDKDGGFTEQQLTLTVLEQAPTLTVDGAASVAEGADYRLDFRADDPGMDTVDEWIVDWGDGVVDRFAGSADTATHRFVDDGARTVRVTARDEDGSYHVDKAVNVSNVAAQLLDLQASDTVEGGVAQLSGRIVDPGLNDSFTLDIDWGDGQTESVAFAAGATVFSIGHVYVDDDPSATTADSYTVSATLRDDDSGSDSADAQLTVGNLAPTVEIALDAVNVVEGALVQVSGNIVDQGLADTHSVMIDWGDGSSSVADVDQLAHTFSASHRYADDNPSGTPSDDYTITAMVTDDDGGQGQAQAVVRIDNAAPIITGIALEEVDDGTTSTVTLTGSLADIGLQDTHVVTVTWGDGSSESVAVDAQTRSFVAQHLFAIDQVPGYRIQVSAQDDDGGVSATVSADTRGYLANRAPAAATYAITLFEGESVTLDLFTDNPDPDGDPIQLFIVEPPAHGSLRAIGNGQVIYQTEPGFNGPDSFRYRLSDGQSGSNVATVSFEVLPVNSVPLARDDAYRGDEDTDIVANVVDNDSDGDGDALTVTLVDGPQHGSLQLDADGGFTYTPDADFHGSDSFSYYVSDDFSDSGAATVTLTIDPVNDAPTAADDGSHAIDEDGVLTVAAADGVLDNDGDIDGDALTASLVGGPSHGTLEFDADGGFRYTPDADFHGQDSFTYVPNDGALGKNVDTVALRMLPVNDAPTAADDAS
ncbi:MAG: tandem-95 repeat protein, partial [Rhodoferax sp.]|nr:tandem-95 repeat protein [Rhodoferax sp.]